MESGKDEGKTEKAVEKVREGKVKNQDCSLRLQIRHFVRVPEGLHQVLEVGIEQVGSSKLFQITNLVSLVIEIAT